MLYGLENAVTPDNIATRLTEDAALDSYRTETRNRKRVGWRHVLLIIAGRRSALFNWRPSAVDLRLVGLEG
jgi:hypothetical protein